MPRPRPAGRTQYTTSALPPPRSRSLKPI
jgi:hypothetical protein